MTNGNSSWRSTWHMSQTRLPQNGEAQLAEVYDPASGEYVIAFNGRSHAQEKGQPYPRGLALSRDGGVTFIDIGFAKPGDRASGISCLASLISHPAKPSALLFSHPAGSSAGSRSAGVLLQSDDLQHSWQLVRSVSPERPHAMFAYSTLNRLPPPANGTISVGITYETGDPGCTPAASACKIVYRTLEIS